MHEHVLVLDNISHIVENLICLGPPEDARIEERQLPCQPLQHNHDGRDALLDPRGVKHWQLALLCKCRDGHASAHEGAVALVQDEGQGVDKVFGEQDL